jgi:hypothetical protein
VVYGYDAGNLRFVKLSAPGHSLPLNRRSWATDLSHDDLKKVLSLFLSTMENPYWDSIIDRAVDWLVLADQSSYESTEQALFTAQTLLEMLSYVMLVEDAQVLSEDGYGKLPASDRITLLCSHSNQGVLPPFDRVDDLRSFCTANSISNIGELIAALRNKLIHPTKKNREYLARVPWSVHATAVECALQIASIAVLKMLGYSGPYYDTFSHLLIKSVGAPTPSGPRRADHKSE